MTETTNLSALNPQHGHGLTTLAGYSVVLTDTTGGTVTRYEVARVENEYRYGRALTLVNEVREVCGPEQYAVIDSLYRCGCRSERIDGSIVAPNAETGLNDLTGVATDLCRCPEEAAGPWDCLGCPVHTIAAAAECAAEQKAEMDAENGWLRAAEYDPRMADPREW